MSIEKVAMSHEQAKTDQIAEPRLNDVCRVLALDGGGAKGFYTLGVLKEIEAIFGASLCEKFDIVFGTSTGAIIAALIALGHTVDNIHDLYKRHVPTVMSKRYPSAKTEALSRLATEVFGDKTFKDVKTGIGIVTTRWLTERPMIFKGNVSQAYGRKSTFTPGFGVTIAEAVEASCSAYPFFQRKRITTSAGDTVELIDGGYCANNPTLYAIADAVVALKRDRTATQVVDMEIDAIEENTFCSGNLHSRFTIAPSKNLDCWIHHACYLQSLLPD
ncbi:MAG: patatin-like phospholipase family protein [Acidobacteriaceae bacterium]